ncbi:NHL repeat-containing protein [Vibrio sp. VPAP30]|uniref:NHL repeat-containing protein n=1 Tax=Vibrio sp. VPAP30 TaxID=1647102 RepID=UPI0009E2C60F|nr:NHL repeat-containing protein [Vibrio sp. VPAP30]
MRLRTIILPIFLAACGTEQSSINQSSQWLATTSVVGNSTITSITGFQGPYGLLVSHDFKLYVPDIVEARVVRFSSELAFEKWLGYSSETNTSGWFDEDLSPSVDSLEAPIGAHSISFSSHGYIVVSAYYNLSVHIYDDSGNFVQFLNSSPNDSSLKFKGPANAYVDPTGNIWVSDYGSHRVFKFDSNYNFIGWLGATSSGPTNGFAQSGEPVSSSALGGFNKPHMVKVDKNGFVYVVEVGNNRIQKFDQNGQPLGWIGAKKNGGTTLKFEVGGEAVPTSLPGGFDKPASIFIHNNQSIIVADFGNNRIQKFNLDGTYVGWLGASKSNIYVNWSNTGESAIRGTSIGHLSSPFDAIIANERLFIADGLNKRIKIYPISY